MKSLSANVHIAVVKLGARMVALVTNYLVLAHAQANTINQTASNFTDCSFSLWI